MLLSVYVEYSPVGVTGNDNVCGASDVVSQDYKLTLSISIEEDMFREGRGSATLLSMIMCRSIV